MPSTLRRRTNLHLMAAILLALITAFFISRWLEQQQSLIREKLASVVVAKQAIQPHTQLDASVVEIVQYPEGLLPPNAISNLEPVLGKVSLTPLAPGQIMTANLIGDKDQVTALSFNLKPGRRAVTIRIDEQSGVGFQLRKGDRVDIISTLTSPNDPNDPDPNEQSYTIAGTILQNVTILELGGILNTGEQQVRRATTATLDLSLEEAEILWLLQSESNISFALRPFADQTAVASTGATMEKALELISRNTPILMPQSEPVAAAPAPQPIQYLRGSESVPVSVQ